MNEERLDLVDYICSEHKFTDVRAFLAVCVADHLEINDIKLHSRLFSNIYKTVHLFTMSIVLKIKPHSRLKLIDLG